MLVTLEGMVMEVRELQPQNAEFPMLVTLEGIIVVLQPWINVFVEVSIIALQLLRESYLLLFSSTIIDVRELQPQNASLPMLVTLEGMEMDVRELQLRNAEYPMLVTLEGMEMDVRELHP